KDEFLALLGHELRNPLAPIATALALIKLRPGAEVIDRERTIIERQVSHLTRLVDGLLAISRVTPGMVPLSRQPVSLPPRVAQSLEAAGPLLEERGHSVTVEVPPELVLDADADRLAQVITNLVVNAIKYTPDRGRISITASADADTACIRVRDN